MTEVTDKEREAKNLRDFWMDEIEAEKKAHEDFRKRASDVVKQYEDIRGKGDNSHKFNIFWSNVEVLKSAVYSAIPKPEVRRRYLDKDPVGRDIAECTERALSYSNDNGEFEDTLDNSITDYLVPGLGQIRIRYTPYFEPGEPPRIPVETQYIIDEMTGEEVPVHTLNGERIDEVQYDEEGPFVLGEPEDELVYQEVTDEQVDWQDFRWQPAKKWSDVRWTAFDHYLTRDELQDQFGENGKDCGLTHHSEGKEDDKDRALVHEIFDKQKRKIIVVSEGLKNKPLAEWDDELGLEGFFPHPKPLMATAKRGKLEPIPDYLFYQDQHRELNAVTERINGLMKMLKLRGVYDGSFEELANILSADEGTMTPVADFTERFQGTGKMESVLAFVPIAQLAPLVKELYSHREAIKQEIYEITGIADIMRGSSNASETLGAQQMKRQFGSMRIKNRQKKVDGFIRDAFRIKAEIIAEHFEPDVLNMMTGIEVTPEMVEVMRSDLLRGYKIDVETDSTIAVDEQEGQKSRMEMLQALTMFIEKLGPMVQAKVVPLPIAKELALFAVRGFPVGRQLEDMLEELGGDEEQQIPPEIQQQLQQGMQQIQELTQQNQELQKQVQTNEQAKFQNDEAQRQHDERMRELDGAIKNIDLAIKEAALRNANSGPRPSGS